MVDDGVMDSAGVPLYGLRKDDNDRKEQLQCLFYYHHPCAGHSAQVRESEWEGREWTFNSALLGGGGAGMKGLVSRMII
jgi:hypothetical protein